MITITEKLHELRPSTAKLVLPFEQRTKSRLLAHLDNGEEVGVTLKRGTILRGGDLLLSSDARVIEVIAAPEAVSVVSSNDPLQLARAAYHLGNRHVSVQIGPGWLRYQHDHVLDEMVRGLGLPVVEAQLPFEPEGGAYAAATHRHFVFADSHGAAHRHD